MIEQFKKEVREELTSNILPYWIGMMEDPRGGFYGCRDGYGVLEPDAPKGAILNARILWTFSAACRMLGDDKSLEVATRAKREIIDRFYDTEYGGVYWSLNADGTPLDTKKQFYALGFAIYGLSEYARATGDPEALEYALRLFHDIEDHSRDRKRGGYFEATQRDWSPIQDMRLSDKDFNASKTMNTHLHIIEPYTNLLRVVPDNGEVREATASLLKIFMEKIVQPQERCHLGLFFDDDWNRQDHIISYGHDIEASWLLLETVQVLSQKSKVKSQKCHAVRETTKRIAMAALEGRCTDGSMVYERHASGSYDNDKHWWVQAENVVGQAWLAKYHNMPEMLSKAYESWQYIHREIIDKEYGEWLWSRRSNGMANRDDDKAGFWKCPYHNARMCLEIMNL